MMLASVCMTNQCWYDHHTGGSSVHRYNTFLRHCSLFIIKLKIFYMQLKKHIKSITAPLYNLLQEQAVNCILSASSIQTATKHHRTERSSVLQVKQNHWNLNHDEEDSKISSQGLISSKIEPWKAILKGQNQFIPQVSAHSSLITSLNRLVM